MRKNNKGFTIVELVVSLALLAIVLVPVSGFFINSFKVQGKTSMNSSITRVAQHIMESFKNKDYLGLRVEGRTLDKYMNAERLENLDWDEDGKFSITKPEEGWEFYYNNIGYVVHIKLKGFKESNISNLEIKSKNECDGVAVINSDGTFDKANTDVSTVDIGGKFWNPINNTVYIADHPTIVYEQTYQSGDVATLWITNNYKAWEEIRIIKGFKKPLHVYIEGNNLSILKGQEGDGASYEQTRITSSYIGTEIKENSPSEVIFEAEMTISNKNDSTINDTFEFSFPVNYEYASGEE